MQLAPAPDAREPDAREPEAREALAQPPAKPKKRPRPTFEDGSLTRVFKFPSKKFPRSSYYVTSTEIIIRIRKARKRWKLVIPKKRVVSYRTNRWFATPRWVELELTFTQASRLGFVDPKPVPRIVTEEGEVACAPDHVAAEPAVELTQNALDTTVATAAADDDFPQAEEAVFDFEPDGDEPDLPDVADSLDEEDGYPQSGEIHSTEIQSGETESAETESGVIGPDEGATQSDRSDPASTDTQETSSDVHGCGVECLVETAGRFAEPPVSWMRVANALAVAAPALQPYSADQFDEADTRDFAKADVDVATAGLAAIGPDLPSIAIASQEVQLAAADPRSPFATVPSITPPPTNSISFGDARTEADDEHPEMAPAIIAAHHRPLRRGPFLMALMLVATSSTAVWLALGGWHGAQGPIDIETAEVRPQQRAANEPATVELVTGSIATVAEEPAQHSVSAEPVDIRGDDALVAVRSAPQEPSRPTPAVEPERAIENARASHLEKAEAGETPSAMPTDRAELPPPRFATPDGQEPAMELAAVAATMSAPEEAAVAPPPPALGPPPTEAPLATVPLPNAPLRTEQPNAHASISAGCAALADAAKSLEIYFDYASAKLGDAALASLAQFAGKLPACGSSTLIVEGHADSDGDAGRNQAVSIRRARAVHAYLVQAGAVPGRMSFVGYGNARPAVPNVTPANKRRNRRAVVIVESSR